MTIAPYLRSYQLLEVLREAAKNGIFLVALISDFFVRASKNGLFS